MRVEMQRQPNQWSCMAAAFAMALRIEVQYVFDYCQHDGSEIIFPDRPEPHCRRGFQLQEMIDVCCDEGFRPVVIEARPQYPMSDKFIRSEMADQERFESYLENNSGVLLGVKEDRTHAVYWYHVKQRIYDPVGVTYDLSKFSPMMLVIV